MVSSPRWLVVLFGLVACGGEQKPAESPSSPPPGATAPPSAVATVAVAPVKAGCDTLDACRSACAPGALPACSQAGYLQLGSNPAEAATFLGRACPDAPGAPRDPQGCHLLAVLRVDGRGVPADPTSGAALLQANCDAGFTSSCDALATEYRSGKRLPPDAPKALALDDRACSLGDPHGCVAAARMLDEGNGVPADDARARSLRQKVCQNRTVGTLPIACTELAEMDQRVQPREKIVYRSFYIEHHESGNHQSTRTPDEAKKLATDAVAALERGEPFDAISDRLGGADPILRISRAEVTTFRLKPTAEHQTPAQTLAPGHATFTPNPSFGFIVWYRVS